MALEAVFERFVKHSPLPVMARLLMQRALSPEWPAPRPRAFVLPGTAPCLPRQ